MTSADGESDLLSAKIPPDHFPFGRGVIQIA